VAASCPHRWLYSLVTYLIFDLTSPMAHLTKATSLFSSTTSFENCCLLYPLLNLFIPFSLFSRPPKPPKSFFLFPYEMPRLAPPPPLLAFGQLGGILASIPHLNLVLGPRVQYRVSSLGSEYVNNRPSFSFVCLFLARIFFCSGAPAIYSATEFRGPTPPPTPPILSGAGEVEDFFTL